MENINKLKNKTKPKNKMNKNKQIDGGKQRSESQKNVKPIRFTTSTKKNGFEWRAYTFRIYSKSFRLSTEKQCIYEFSNAIRINRRCSDSCRSTLRFKNNCITYWHSSNPRKKNERNFSFPDSFIFCFFSSFEQLDVWMSLSLCQQTLTYTHTQTKNKNNQTPPPACIGTNKLCTAYIHRFKT